MPFYDYKCDDCNYVIEVVKSIKDESPVNCKKCKKQMRKLITNVSFKLNGSGWFKDGYSKPKK